MRFPLTRREYELLQLKQLSERPYGVKFNFAHVAARWGVSKHTVRNTLKELEWKLRLMDFFPILALNGRVINQLRRFYHDGNSMEGVVSMSDAELLHCKWVGKGSLPALRALAEALIRMPQERRKEAQDFLFGPKER